jgi:hypothetical protein
MREQNNRRLADFEGHSPAEMNVILYATLEAESPIKLQKLNEPDYQLIPLLNQIRYLINLIQDKGEIKLTAKGFLPTKIVADLYEQGFVKDEFIERGMYKLYKETDSDAIHLTRILLEISGLVKKRNGKLSLTKASQKTIVDNDAMLRLLITTFASKFNWAYFDAFGEDRIGQLGWGFSLILLAKYGHEKQLNSFYAQKYFKAFPVLLDDFEPTPDSIDRYSVRCYSIRTFDRFLEYFGLVHIEEVGKGFDRITYISRTELFDRLITYVPSGNVAQ